MPPSVRAVALEERSSRQSVVVQQARDDHHHHHHHHHDDQDLNELQLGDFHALERGIALAVARTRDIGGRGV